MKQNNRLESFQGSTTPLTTNTANSRLERIENDEWTLYDQILYGGLGYGHFCVPKNLVRILFTIIFPPIGMCLKYTTDKFPFMDFAGLFANITSILTCFVLTSLFYVPGLIYALNQIHDDKDQRAKDQNAHEHGCIPPFDGDHHRTPQAHPRTPSQWPETMQNENFPSRGARDPLKKHTL